MARATERFEIRLTPEERHRIETKMREVNVRNMSAFIRKMSLDGICINMDTADIREMTSLLRRCSNNLNQYAKRANETGSIYEEDILDVKYRLEEIWERQGQLIKKLGELKI